jgi:two-component system, NtrC family, nitrogen regulation sensor histidine kinase NtrY
VHSLGAAIRIVNVKWGWRLAYAAAGVVILLLAYWLRNPLIPYGRATPGASGISADSVRSDEAQVNRLQAIRALRTAIVRQQRDLVTAAASALNAPLEPEEAFEYLRSLPTRPEGGVLLIDAAGPIAWAGQFRSLPAVSGTGTSVSFSPFYTTLQVQVERNGRKAIASALIHADAPANRIAAGIDDELSERDLVESFHFAPLSDTTGGEALTGGTGHPLFRVDAVPLSAEVVRFAQTAEVRARGAVLLVLAVIAFMAVGWSNRRALGFRLFTIVVAVAAIALVPWNNFSNFSRAFDPAYFYSAIGGPLTASSGPLAMVAALLVIAMIALIRSRPTRIPRIVASIGCVVFAAAGIVITEAVAVGIVLPTGGATSSLWITWEAPLFLLLFSFWLCSLWLARIAIGRRAMVPLRTAAVLALLCGSVATFIVWTKTTEQRLQLAMRDVAGLQRVDGDATQLLTRFGSELAAFGTAGTRADLLKRFAASDLAAAELQISLGTWKSGGVQMARIDLAELPFDSATLASVVKVAIDSAQVTVHPVIGLMGRQVMLAVPHRDGTVTSAVASPRTRLVPQNPYLALLGFDQPDKTEPPYTLTLADVTPGGGAKANAMTWRRVDNEWHGDEIVPTSGGLSRAHVEVDLRSWPTRIVRAALLVILDVAIAGILWALATMAEGGFLRWVRWRARRWVTSYHGRLTLALFTFFVFPAVGFAFWSYQRLQADDRGVRELLVKEVLSAAASGTAAGSEMAGASIAGSPLFLYSDGALTRSSDSLYEMIAPAGRLLPRRVYVNIALHGELTATSRQTIARTTMFWGYRAGANPNGDDYVLAAPARSDELVLDRRRRDLTLLVLFATAVGAIAAFWLSGIAAKILARDLELSRIEVARAERVLAWGEMARQIAHEIKNPLTPIRLGVQHLRRARADKRIDFDKVLDENVTRILSEIDRLDKIARTFSRYGSSPGELPQPERVDVAAILRDVVALEKMGIGGVAWTLEGADAPAFAAARNDELRDVLLNVFENARLARARSVRVNLASDDESVRIEIADDGAGIPNTALPRVFEPHFSTRTTGSGLGLAISRRLIESWGGGIDLESEEGKGARVAITLQSIPA